MKKSQEIQILRGIAIFLVIGFHFGFLFTEFGFLGVDIFFVISGYLMHSLYGSVRTKREILKFYERRMRRLLPSYLLCLLVFSGLAVFLLRTHELRALLSELPYHLLFLTNFHEWTQEQYFSNSQFRPFLNFWSLSVEVQFYLLFPILAIVAKTQRGKISLLFLFASTLILFIAMESISPSTAFYMLPLRLWEFLAGFFVSQLKLSEDKRLMKESSIRISPLWLLILILGFEHSPWVIPNYLDNLMVICITAGCLLYVRIEKFSKGKVSNFFSFIGDHSYSIYLYHLPLLLFSSYKPFEGNLYRFDSLAEATLAIVLLVLLVIANRFLAEKPAVFKRQAWNLYRLSWLLVTALAFPLMLNTNSIYSHKDDKRARVISDSQLDRGIFRCGTLYRLEFLKILGSDFKTCALSEAKWGPPILLVGNSHADSIKESFAESVVASGYKPYLIQENNMISKENLGDILEVVDSLKPQIVVFHSRAGSYDMKSFESVLKYLDEQGIGIIVVESVPTFDESIPAYLLSKNMRYLAASKEDIKAFTRELKGLSRLMRKYEFTYLRVRDLYCLSKTNICRIIDQKSGSPLYYDSSHLTLTGAKIIGLRLRDAVANYN